MLNFWLILAVFLQIIAESVRKIWIIPVFLFCLIMPWPINLFISAEDALAEEAIIIEQAIYPVIKEKQPRSAFQARLTAYSSTVDQCDGNPFITASGATVKDGIVATNCLPFGTRLKIPSIFGDKIFTVQDRMSWRYGCAGVDIWFPDRASAMRFGKAYAEVFVF